MALDDRWRGARARLQVSAWRGQDRVAVLTPMPDRPGPGPDEIRTEVERLRSRGVERILTGALHHGEVAAFEAAGFVEHERLHLLRHDLRSLPEIAPSSRVHLRRAWWRDQSSVLAIDGRAFDTFWSLDHKGLDDAVRATPSSRFRVALSDNGTLSGYAVTGRAGDRGYLQRLAVDPPRHRSGTGRRLVADGLGWLKRTGTRLAVVNTQEHNEAALRLYLSTGFVMEPHGLTVLTDRRAGP